tara:strand:+ start:232 stop:342 length:111 start_codon:yes stop_codon:yes gene_type:complete
MVVMEEVELVMEEVVLEKQVKIIVLAMVVMVERVLQ